LIKLFFRCKEFFVIRSRIIKILKLVHTREQFLQSFQRLVKELNTSVEHERELKNEKSDKSMALYSMTKELKIATDVVARDILAFLGEYRKYFGKTFIYEGTVIHYFVILIGLPASS
jgi:hypothetical protein